MKQYAISSCHFTTSHNRNYVIVQTEYGKSRSVLDAIDTIKNPEGRYKKMRRPETIKLINS